MFLLIYSWTQWRLDWRVWQLEAQIWLFTHGYVWLGLHLPRLLRRAPSNAFFLLWVVEIGREIRLLWVFPARARRLATRGEFERAIALMRRSVGAFTPLLGTRPLFWSRAFTLGQMLENARRHGEANAVWEDLARRPHLAPAFEAEVRKRWANGLEILGDLGGAERQRALVEDRIQNVEAAGGGQDWSILLQRGLSANDANRFSESLSLLERALDAPKFGLTAAKRDALEAEIACRVALAAYQCGNNGRAESAARLALEGAKTPFWRGQGFRTLALSLGTQNRLPEALEASRAAREESAKVGDANISAHDRSQYALLLLQSGQVKAALQEIEIAAATALDSSHVIHHHAANCHTLLGDYAAARAALERARRATPFPNPAAERQMQGALDMEGANIEMKATQFGGEERAQTAWDLLQRAKTNLQGFERLLFWLEAAEASNLALLGQSDAARRQCELLAARLGEFEDDPATLNAIWTMLAETYQQLGEWQVAHDWWRRYLDAPFGRPVYRADALCSCGECLRAVGDQKGARECWQQVVAMGFDIAATKRAQKLLSELSAAA